MKIITNIKQGSKEWLDLRMGKVTASNFSKIITSTGKESATIKKYAMQLASECLMHSVDEQFSTPAMQRGNELEDEARMAYEEATFTIVDQIAMFDCGDYSYSPDGLIGNDGLLEIKCPSSPVHVDYLYQNKLPSCYKAQCQGGLMISEREYLDFVSYHPLFFDDQKIFIKRVYRDEQFIKKLKECINNVIDMRDELIDKIKKTS